MFETGKKLHTMYFKHSGVKFGEKKVEFGLKSLNYSFEPLACLLEYFFSCFGCTDMLVAKQVLNSKQPAIGYDRIILGILRRSGYFNLAIYD